MTDKEKTMSFTSSAVSSPQVATVMGRPVTYAQTIQSVTPDFMGPAIMPTVTATTTATESFSFTGFFKQLGTLAETFGYIQTGRQQAQAYQYNAAIQRQREELAKKKGELELERQRKRARSFRKSQEAAYLAAGVKLTGSPLEVILDSATELELDAQIGQFNAKLEALGYATEADLSLYRAQQAKYSGYIKAGETLLLSATEKARKIPRF